MRLPAVEFVNGLDPVIDMQLLVNVVDMFANRFLADKQKGGYFLVKHALGQ